MEPRPELYSDVADQFERMEQPMNMGWMQQRGVSLEELHALSQSIALVLRGYAAMHPLDRVRFVTRGILTARPLEEPAETVLGARQSAGANQKPTTMKIKVNRPTEVEVTHVEIDVPVDADEDCVEAGDFPFMTKDADGKHRWKARVRVDDGQIEDWPEKAGTRHFRAFPRDAGTYRLIGPAPDNKVVAEIKEGYVPNLCVPGDYGDSVDLEIDHRGRVTNWPKKPDFCEFFKDAEDD